MKQSPSVAPDSYKPGIQYVESLDPAATKVWLLEELFEKNHYLSGRPEDFPVQSLLNHYQYFSPETQERITNAFVSIQSDWESSPNDWSESATRSLLSLVATLPVSASKLSLKILVASDGLFMIPSTLHAAIYRAIATLSSKEDESFWKSIRDYQPEFARMAKQVLARIH